MKKSATQKSVVLAEGELTGHAHRAVGDVDLVTEGSRPVLKVASETADVVHEEHKAFTLPRGSYDVDRVKEYDHWSEEARTVQD
jgi:hypothetical protein